MKIALIFLLFSLLNVPSFAVKQSYIVYMGAHSHGPDATTEDFDRVTGYHHDFLASFLGSVEEAKDSIIYSYTRVINGFSANVEEHHAVEIAKHQDVISVFRNKGLKKHTTYSWYYMMLEKNDIPELSWAEARFGEDVIIANLDSGVWPESESFDDKGYGSIPSKWKGTCENSNMTGGVHCNRKLIGARYFNKGYKAEGGNVTESMESARDFDGHGTHTLSTAGGNFVKRATINGNVLGTAKGGSPRARVAAYKVCWTTLSTGGECFSADIMAALDMAIYDGVDVLSLSIGAGGYLDGRYDYSGDAISIGAYHAFQKGVVVVCSAGNSGPYGGTVTNTSPWIITVAASTMDREFQSIVKLGNGHQLKGLSMSRGLNEDKLYPLISAADAKLSNASATDAINCMAGTLDSKKAKGKILAYMRGGDNTRVDKGRQVRLVGGVGMILCNEQSDGNEVLADPDFLPAVHINYRDGLALFEYINSTKEPMAYITSPSIKYGDKPAPRVAARGPCMDCADILKPDITAPGENVVAAFTGAWTVDSTEKPSTNRAFMVQSGTSMSCPHIAGIAGLLKAHHPTWSAAAIKSATMTTARTRDNTGSSIKEESDLTKANPFGYGAGHVRPNRAMDPGLVYDITADDYLDYLCAVLFNKTEFGIFSNGSHTCPDASKALTSVRNLNYPSFMINNLNDTVTVSRTLKNVGSPGVYVARVRHPAGVSVTVEPNVLKFEKYGEEKKFNISFTKVKAGRYEQHRFGELLWSDGFHFVRSPIAIITFNY